MITIPEWFPLPAIDIVQARVTSGRCVVCGGASVERDSKTGFPEHVCSGCAESIHAQTRARVRAAARARLQRERG